VSTTELEGTGPNFSTEKFLEMRLRTREAVHTIAGQIEAGMVEDDARAMARDTLAGLGMRRGWHHVITRFGPNTTKDFMAPSEKGVVLGDNDIFFIDIGPVKDDIEGDAGETFVLGDDPEHHRAKADARAIWDEVRAVWSDQRLSGRALYDYAVKAAETRDWVLNMDLSGHRLSDFPHSAHYDGPMAEVDIIPSPGLWVLEIAIRHPHREFGAFYEDLLLEDQSF
jgi:methionyl aminopeptidase